MKKLLVTDWSSFIAKPSVGNYLLNCAYTF